MSPSKTCTSCGVEKPRSEFHRCRAFPDGLHYSCKECKNAVTRQWNADNRERLRAGNRRRYLARRAERQAYARADYRRNAARYQARARERERLLGRASKDTIAFTQILRHDPCAYCGAPAAGVGQVDHIEAVSMGGANHWDNLTAACLQCNATKKARPLLDFLAAPA